MTVSKPAYVYTEPYNQDHSYVSNRLNQITSVSFGTAFSMTLPYDANGNLTGDGLRWQYDYDIENRLISASGPEVDIAFTYDPLGRRSRKTVTGAVSSDVRTIYDGMEAIADTNAAGTTLQRYVFGPGIDEPVAMYTGPGIRFYLTDPQGSVVGLTDGAGTLQTTYRYSAYGVPDQYEVPSGGNQLRYTGQRLDAETGLYYYRARYYSPSLGRFLQTDPIGYGDGLNLYAYVGNDPVNLRDPSGLGAAALRDQFQSGALAPGGLLLNQGISSIGRGNYLLGSAQIAGSFAEAALAIATVGQGTTLLQTTRTATISLSTTAATKSGNTVIGRVKDLQNLKKGEQSLLHRLPDRGSPKANWKQNSGVLRQEIGKGKPIRDASPGDSGGQFLNAERKLLRDRGWTFDSKTNYWNPPN